MSIAYTIAWFAVAFLTGWIAHKEWAAWLLDREVLAITREAFRCEICGAEGGRRIHTRDFMCGITLCEKCIKEDAAMSGGGAS